jgi:hypothetical protein
MPQRFGKRFNIVIKEPTISTFVTVSTLLHYLIERLLNADSPLSLERLGLVVGSGLSRPGPGTAEVLLQRWFACRRRHTLFQFDYPGRCGRPMLWIK